MNVAEAVIDYLEKIGVGAVFGVPAGNIAPFNQALMQHPRMKFVIASHEGGAAFMADGYARSSGKLGVCLTAAGPGATNALTGVASAYVDQIPVLIITGQVPTFRYGLGPFQESTETVGVNLVDVYRSSTSCSTSIVDVGSFRRLFLRAVSMTSGPRGTTAHLNIPMNIAQAALDDGQNWPPSAVSHTESTVMSGDFGKVTAALEALRRAKHPLILLGGGARNALATHYQEFDDFVSRYRIPVATSTRAKGIFSEYHSSCLGVAGMGGKKQALDYIQSGVDVLLVLGSSLGEWATRGFNESFRDVKYMVHVDLNPGVFNQFIPADLAIVGDARAILNIMGEFSGKESSDSASLVSLAKEGTSSAPASPEASSSTPLLTSDQILAPDQVLKELDPYLHGNTDVYVDMGNCVAWATNCLMIEPPTRIFYPCGLASMGWSCGAVIGGKIASPERVAISLVGDGALMMNGTEIRTAAKYNVGVIFLVLNDNYLGMVHHGERAAMRGAYEIDDPYYDIGGPDLVKFAESLGAEAYSIDAPGQLQEIWPTVLERAQRDNRPQVVVARIDFRSPPPFAERFTSLHGPKANEPVEEEILVDP